MECVVHSDTLDTPASCMKVHLVVNIRGPLCFDTKFKLLASLLAVWNGAMACHHGTANDQWREFESTHVRQPPPPNLIGPLPQFSLIPIQLLIWQAPGVMAPPKKFTRADVAKLQQEEEAHVFIYKGRVYAVRENAARVPCN